MLAQKRLGMVRQPSSTARKTSQQKKIPSFVTPSTACHGPWPLDPCGTSRPIRSSASGDLEAGKDRQGAIVWEGDVKANDVLLPVEGLAVACENRGGDGICSSPEFEPDGASGGRREG